MVRRAAEGVRALQPGKYRVDGGRLCGPGAPRHLCPPLFWLVLHDPVKGTKCLFTQGPTANSTRARFLKAFRSAVSRGDL